MNMQHVWICGWTARGIATKASIAQVWGLHMNMWIEYDIPVDMERKARQDKDRINKMSFLQANWLHIMRTPFPEVPLL